MAKFENIDDYINQLPTEVQMLARALRQTIKNSDLRLVEAIRYDMPAYRLGATTVIHFAVWKKHIGMYPIYRGTDDLEAQLEPYRAKTDTIQFKLNQPVPHDLVAKIVVSQMSRIGHRL